MKEGKCSTAVYALGGFEVIKDYELNKEYEKAISFLGGLHNNIQMNLISRAGRVCITASTHVEYCVRMNGGNAYE